MALVAIRRRQAAHGEVWIWKQGEDLCIAAAVERMQSKKTAEQKAKQLADVVDGTTDSEVVRAADLSC